MKPMRENYFVKRYVEPLTIGQSVRYRPIDEVLAPEEEGVESRILRLAVASEICVMLLFLVEKRRDEATEWEFLLYDAGEGSYRRLPVVWDGSELPRQIGYRKERLVLRFDERVQIHSLREDRVTTLSLAAKEAALGESLYLLVEGGKILRYGYDGSLLEEISFDPSAEPVGIDYKGDLHTMDRLDGTLRLDSEPCAAPPSTPHSFAYLGAKECLCETEEALWHCGAEARRIAPVTEGYDTDCMGNLWVLSAGRVLKFAKMAEFEAERVETITFDAFSEATEWSRLELEMELPSGCSLELEAESDSGSVRMVDAPKVLLYGIRGRKLRVTLRLLSDSTRRSAPVVTSVKGIFDATAYIDYMPACYRKEPETLHRYLSIFQSVSRELEDAVARLPRMLDVQRCDDDFLTWLSGWVGLRRDFRWPEERWREFLRRAPDLYTRNGTKRGLEEIVAIYTGEAPVIEEYEAEGKRFFFCLKVSADVVERGADIEVVRSIVEAFKPAHTVARVMVDQAIDATPQLVVGESVLPYDTVIEQKKERKDG